MQCGRFEENSGLVKMKTGTIVRNGVWVGVVTGNLPDGRAACLFGNETRQFPVSVNPSALSPVEIIDMTPGEHEDVLHLMQSLVFSLAEDAKPF